MSKYWDDIAIDKVYAACEAAQEADWSAEQTLKEFASAWAEAARRTADYEAKQAGAVFLGDKRR